MLIPQSERSPSAALARTFEGNVRARALFASVAFGITALACSDATESPYGGAAGVSPASSGATAASAGSSAGGVAAPGGSTSGGGASSAGDTTTAGTASAGTTTTGTAGGGNAAGAGEGGAHVIDPSLPPGMNYELSGFALQLPLPSGDSVKQITSPELASYTSEFFYSGEDGAIVFWCPVNGATTPNSHYPRTELRERAVGGDWTISGSHKLSATFKMLENPASKGTIIGQIHGNATGGTSEVLKLEWTSDNELVASVEANDDPAKQLNHTLGSYELGELITYTFELEGSVLDITVTNADGEKKFSTPYTAASWEQDRYYFKLGSYVQLDTGPATDGGRVAFYAFDIQHGP